jgi:uncharacterized protein YutE (UPF0331/DUF86 family)
MTADSFPDDRLNRILDAVKTIEESVGILVRKQQLDREEYKADSETRDVVERRFVKMTESAIDIAEELVKQERGEPPASNPESMQLLDEVGVLSTETAEQMAQAARFRNVLSHTPTAGLSTTTWFTTLCRRISNDIERSSSRRANISIRSVPSTVDVSSMRQCTRRSG